MMRKQKELRSIREKRERKEKIIGIRKNLGFRSPKVLNLLGWLKSSVH